MLKAVCRELNMEPSQLRDDVLCSVVPSLTTAYQGAAKKHFQCETLTMRNRHHPLGSRPGSAHPVQSAPARGGR